jgi:hypothetical protein
MSDDKMVQVDPVDPAKKTSEIAGPAADEATISMELMNENCFWNDREFKLGQRVSAGGKCYECSFGRWLEVDAD